MKVLDTNWFIYEQTKIKPVTNAEWSALQDRMKRIINPMFVIWPKKRAAINKIKKYMNGIKAEVKTQNNISIFVLYANDILQLFQTIPITVEPDEFDLTCKIFEIKDTTISDAAMKHKISCSLYGNDIYDFLMNEKNAHHFTTDNEIEERIKEIIDL